MTNIHNARATAEMTPYQLSPEKMGWKVSVRWEADILLDRPVVSGWVLPNKRTAERLAQAINAGVVHEDIHIRTDINGKTFVAATELVSGRTANADLRRLGF